MRLVLLACAALLAAWQPPVAGQQATGADLKEFAVEWGGRTRDPAVAPDGKVWFVGQEGNYLAWFDPRNGQFKRYEIEEGTNPHSVNVDAQGIVWYTGNRNGRIGRLDPARGELTVIMTGEAKDPHTHVFDGKGHMWFTSQGSNRIGRLDLKTQKVDLITPNNGQPSNPYGIVIDKDGYPWVALLRTNTVVRVDPTTLALTSFKQAHEASRSRRIEATADGMIWYVDETRGYLGRINPATSEAKEWAAPGGANSRPYALTKDDQGRLWFSETGSVKQLVSFDPKTEKFSVHPVSGTIRHMAFHAPTKTMWFGTDANNIGRIVTTTVK
jgi:virginiamycin B lyase